MTERDDRMLEEELEEELRYEDGARHCSESAGISMPISSS